MQKTCFKVAFKALFMLILSMRSLARLSLVFCIAIFLWLGIFCCILTFFVIVKTNDMTQVFASHASNVRSMDNGG